MLPALLHRHSEVRKRRATCAHLLLTDGDLGNEEQISTLCAVTWAALVSTLSPSAAPPTSSSPLKWPNSARHFSRISPISPKFASRWAASSEQSRVPSHHVKLTFEGIEVAHVYPSVPRSFPSPTSPPLRPHLPGPFRPLASHCSRGRSALRSEFRFRHFTASFHPGITTLWARQRVEDLIDHWPYATRMPAPRFALR